MDEEQNPYITIGNNRYPIPINTPISTQIVMDEPSPGYTTPPPVAQFKRSWANMRNHSGVITWDKVELTEHGATLMQEYLASGRCDITITYEGCYPVAISSRRKPSLRNTRVQKVQAKRKTLDLGHDGKCCSLRTRKASLALRKAEQEWYDGERAEQPVASEYERVSPRVQRKQARDARRFYRSFGPLENDSNFLDLSHYMTREIVRAFALPSPVIGVVDQEIAHVFAIPPGEIGEMYNGNR